MLEIILYMLLAIIGISLLAIALIGALLFVAIFVVAAAESLAHKLFSRRG